MGQEKVHGGLQQWAGSDGDYGEHISSQRDSIDDQTHHKYDFLHVWILCESQQNELRNVVPSLHGSNMLLSTTLPATKSFYFLAYTWVF